MLAGFSRRGWGISSNPRPIIALKGNYILQEYSIKPNRIISGFLALVFGLAAFGSLLSFIKNPSFPCAFTAIFCGFIAYPFSRLVFIPKILTLNKQGVYLYKHNVFKLHFMPWSKITSCEMMSIRLGRCIAFHIENSDHEIDTIYWLYCLKQHINRDVATLIVPLTFEFFMSSHLMDACEYFQQKADAAENNDVKFRFF